MMSLHSKKIVIIRNAAPQDFGGGERFPVFLSEILITEGLTPILVSRSQKLLDFAAENNIKTVKGWWWSKQQWSGGNNLLIPLYIIWQLTLFFYYISLFSRHKPDAIHIQSKDDFIAATYAGKALKKPVVWTDHADLKHVFQNISVWYKNPIGKMIYHAAKHANSITVVSESERQLITAHLPEGTTIKNKLLVIYNGVLNLSQSFPKKNHKTFTFLVASRLVKDKGIQEVMDAFSELNQIHPDTTLKIIGDGPESNMFKSQNHSTSIEFLGHQSQPLNFMANADVFVHPTYHEGFSVALVEAGMMSLPIIATAVGGNVEIINNDETGLLVPVKDVAGLHRAMEQLYENTALRQKLAQNAHQQYLERFQFDIIVKNKFMPLYGGAQ